MNTECTNCGVVLDDGDAIVNRRGTFCTPDCAHRHAIDTATVPVMSDEQWLIEPDEVQPTLPSHP